MEQDIKTFPLMKYFTITASICIMVTTAILSLLYWNASLSNILWHGENDNIAFNHALGDSVWSELQPYLENNKAAISETDGIQKTIRIHTLLNNHSRATPILKVKIIDLDGHTIYSSDKNDVGYKMPANYAGKITASTGKPVSILRRHSILLGLHSKHTNVNAVATYLPITLTQEPGRILGVIEVFSNVTQQMNNLKKKQFLVIPGILAVMLILFLILFFLVRKADQTIRLQSDDLYASMQIINGNYDVLERRTRQLTVARDTALEANRAKSAFLANMSHELRTPLNAIIGYSELMADEIKDVAPDALGDLTRINNAGVHLLNLINNILDISKIEAGKMDNHIESFNIYETVSDVVASIEPLVSKNDNKLCLNVTETIGNMECDITKLRQILFNLISNASKFTDKGVITLSVSRINLKQAEWLEFRVTDTGIGMSPEQLKRLFKPFSQADSSTTKKYGGTGLGLAISRRLSELLGGSIKVTSQLNEGSSFAVILPSVAPHSYTAKKAEPITVGVKADPAKIRLGEEQTPIDPRRKKISTILVIDDNADIRDLMERYLTRQGFYVHSAANAEEGMELAERINPDLITLDVMMPEKDGWSVLSDLKNNAELTSIPVIMLTLSGEKDLGFALGAADYLTKPIDWKVLHESVVTNLRKAYQEKMNQQ